MVRGSRQSRGRTEAISGKRRGLGAEQGRRKVSSGYGSRVGGQKSKRGQESPEKDKEDGGASLFLLQVVEFATAPAQPVH